jgi:hypothetical protein
MNFLFNMYLKHYSDIMARKGGLFEFFGLPYVGFYQNFRLTKWEFFP